MDEPLPPDPAPNPTPAPDVHSKLNTENSKLSPPCRPMDSKGDELGKGQGGGEQGKAVAEKPKKRRWFQFSLRSLLILVLFLGSVLTVWMNRSVWGLAFKLIGHTDSIRTAMFSLDGTRILTASWDGTARIWDAKTGLSIGTLGKNNAGINSATYSYDGNLIAVARLDGIVDIFDERSFDKKFSIKAHYGSVEAVLFSPNNKLILTANGNDKEGTACLWDAVDGSLVGEFKNGTDHGVKGSLCAIAFSPNSELFATGSADSTARIWNTETLKQQCILRHQGAVQWVGFIENGRELLTASEDFTACIWVANTGQQRCKLLGHSGGIVSAGVSHDGRNAFTTSGDGTARIWNTENGSLMKILQGHKDTVWSAAFSHDDTHIVTASKDGTARVWSYQTSLETTVLTHGARGVKNCMFSPDDQYILTTSDNTGFVWNRQRPDSIYGLLALKASWVALLLLCLLIWSTKAEYAIR